MSSRSMPKLMTTSSMPERTIVRRAFISALLTMKTVSHSSTATSLSTV